MSTHRVGLVLILHVLEQKIHFLEEMEIQIHGI